MSEPGFVGLMGFVGNDIVLPGVFAPLHVFASWRQKSLELFFCHKGQRLFFGILLSSDLCFKYSLSVSLCL